jgi:multiple sugar transport system substrate-binding protein
MLSLTRRRLGQLLGGAAAASVAFGALGRTARAQTRLRLFWWGNPDRDRRTFEVVDLYQQKHPDVVVDAESLSWPDYWPKMATQAAGGNMADVIQMDYRYMFEYARRQQLEPLDGYQGSAFDLSQFNPDFLDSGRVDGALYAVPMGGNSTSAFYDKTKLDELGIAMPDHLWTYDDLREIAKAIAEATPEGYWGASDNGDNEQGLEIFVRQRGKALYTEDGQMAFDEEDVVDYFGFWDGMRRDGLVPPPDVQASDTGDLDKLMITTGKAAIDFANSNQLVGIQALTQNTIELQMYPNAAGGQPGQYLKPAMQLSLAATGQNKEAAAQLLGFFVTDLEAGEIQGVERGVPGDAKVRAHIADAVGEQEKKMVDYLDVVATNVSPLPPPPPKGAGEIQLMQLRLYPQVSFERMSVKEAAAQFVREAEAILRRA